MPKNEKRSRPCLWTVLAVINVVGIAFPLSHYLQTDGETDARGQIFAAVLLVCAVLFFVVVDGVTALLSNFNVNEL